VQAYKTISEDLQPIRALEVPTAESIPLSTDSQGTIRVGGTRVTLDTVVEVYQAGSTPEEIVRHFPTLQLADVYAVLTYYLRHQTDVDAYLHRRQEETDAIQREAEAGWDRPGLRDRLLPLLKLRSLQWTPEEEQILDEFEEFRHHHPIDFSSLSEENDEASGGEADGGAPSKQSTEDRVFPEDG
jgi:uncharacterized protein (DUF433 family)